MKILNLHICLFILLFFSSCKKINVQKDIPPENRTELLGLWKKNEDTDNNNFSINFGKIKGDSIFGQYYAVAVEGNAYIRFNYLKIRKDKLLNHQKNNNLTNLYSDFDILNLNIL